MMSIDELLFEFEDSRCKLWNHLFYYKDGILYWKNPRANAVKRGDVAGQFNSRYFSCNVCSKRFYIHRITFEMHYGDTDLEIDHIDRDTTNNRLENLRAVSRSENRLNIDVKSNNKSGYTGVSFHKATEKWNAQVNINGRRKSLGFFKTPEEANLARLQYFEDK